LIAKPAYGLRRLVGLIQPGDTVGSAALPGGIPALLTSLAQGKGAWRSTRAAVNGAIQAPPGLCM
jgi:hypothetical protein